MKKNIEKAIKALAGVLELDIRKYASYDLILNSISFTYSDEETKSLILRVLNKYKVDYNFDEHNTIYTNAKCIEIKDALSTESYNVISKLEKKYSSLSVQLTVTNTDEPALTVKFDL